MPKVFIILVNYNGYKDTIECLISLEKVQYSNFEIIIIDNGSNNNSLKELESFLNSYKNNFKTLLLESGENKGFSGGNNIGIKKALENNADYVLLLNNDTVVSQEFLTELVRVAESNKKIGIVGPKIYYIDSNIIWFAGGYFSWLGGGQHKKWRKIDDNPNEIKIERSDYMTGCAMLIKKEVFEKIGFLDDNFFLYYEDTDFSLRAKKFDYEIFYAPSAKIWHKISVSAKKMGEPIIHYYHIRNALLLTKKNANIFVRFGVYSWSLFLYLKQIFKIIFFPNKRESSQMIMRGIEDFYKEKFGKLTIVN